MTPEMEKAERKKFDAIYPELAIILGESTATSMWNVWRSGREELRAELARASECHSLTEEEAKLIVEPHLHYFLTGDEDEPEIAVVYVQDVVRLLMEHSDPSPVLEKVRKRITSRLVTIDKAVEELKAKGSHPSTYDPHQQRASELSVVLSIITELSKGK